MSIDLSVQEKKLKIDFKDGDHGGHLVVLNETILAIFDVQVTQMLPTKFQIRWPFGSGEEAKIDFEDGRHGSHFGFPIGTVLSIFNLEVTLMLHTELQVKWTFGSGEEAKNRSLIYKSPRCLLPSYKSTGPPVRR